MASFERPPLVGIPACLVIPERFGFHQVGDKYVTSVIDGAGALPLLIPAVGEGGSIRMICWPGSTGC